MSQAARCVTPVAVDPAPPAGVFSFQWSFLKANWPMVNPLVSQFTPRRMSFEDFQYAFVNTLPLDEQRAAYERYVVPESRRVPRESTGGIAKIDFKRTRPPLLIIAGSADHIIPASLNRSVVHYSASLSAISGAVQNQAQKSTADFAACTGRFCWIVDTDQCRCPVGEVVCPSGGLDADRRWSLQR